MSLSQITKIRVFSCTLQLQFLISSSISNSSEDGKRGIGSEDDGQSGTDYQHFWGKQNRNEGKINRQENMATEHRGGK